MSSTRHGCSTTLGAAIEDLNFVYATTARERDGFKPVRGPVEAARMLRARARAGQQTGILFGRERFGLDNDEVSLADEIVTFPGRSRLRVAEYRPGGAADVL